MENLDQLQSKCVSALIYIKLMGEYARDQLDGAFKCKINPKDLECLSSTTRLLFKQIIPQLDMYDKEIQRLMDFLKTELPCTPSDAPSSDSTLIADVKNIKAENSKLLTLRRSGSIEENTDDDFLEIYRIETITEHGPNVIEEESVPQHSNNFGCKEDGKSSDNCKDEDSDATMCSLKSEDEKVLEALKCLGGDDETDSLSDVPSSYSRSSCSVSPVRLSGHNTEPGFYKYSDQEYCDTYNVKPCYVLLKNIYAVSTNSNPRMDDHDKEMQAVNRLTNMSDLDKINNSACKPRIRSKATKHKEDKFSDSDTQSNSSTESDEGDLLKEISTSDLPSPVTNEDEDLDHVQDLLCTLGESDADDESNTENESNDEKKIKKPKKKCEKRRHDNKEERKQKRLRLDPLLTTRISSPLSGEETGELFSVKHEKQVEKEDVLSEDDKKNIKKIKCTFDGHSESDDDIQKKTKRQSFLPVEHVLLSSDLSDDSDCEFIGSVPKTEDGDKGRRNIRAIKSKETLAKDTQHALRLEEERIHRVIEQKKKISQSLSQLDESEDTGLVLDVEKDTGNPLIVVDSMLTKKLKEHQKHGVRFMWNNCYESVERLKTSKGTGCILAHCMGLGKTLQAITLIHTLFNHPITNTKHILIVCPLSTVLNWRNEFKIMLENVGGINMDVKIISDRINRLQKLTSVSRWYASGGVLILGYECFVCLVKDLIEGDSRNKTSTEYKALLAPGPDVIICDEGHLIRNMKSRRSRALMSVETKRRIILTGTPLQNNLAELYQMVQFVKPNLLGTKEEFMNRFGHPILNGGYYDSNVMDIKMMQKRSHVLHTYLKETVQRYEVSELKMYLPEKLDYVVFISLHQVQVELYKHYLALTSIAPVTSKQFLADYIVLRNVWSHPYTLYQKEKEKSKGKENTKQNDDVILADNTLQCIPKSWYKEKCPDNILTLEYGPKILVTMSIIEECEKIGDKILIFASFLANLNIIEHFLKTHGTSRCRTWTAGVDYLRMDGSVPLDIRNEYCNNFMKNNNIRVFLISHKVGGMGLNLFAANRVIIMDISFNPAIDNQSIYRIYRFGQKKKCYVYRLVTMGTMEETVYERSVTKSSISARVVDEKQITRHFKRSDLEQMYRFKDTSGESRPIPRVPKDAVLANILHKHKEVFKYHDYQALLENQLDEKLDEQEQQAAWEEFKAEQENARLQAEARNMLLVNPLPYDPKNYTIAPSPSDNQVPLFSNGTSIPNNNASGVFVKSNELTNRMVFKLNVGHQDKLTFSQQSAVAKPPGVIQQKSTNNHSKSTIVQEKQISNQLTTSTKQPILIIQKQSKDQLNSPIESIVLQEQTKQIDDQFTNNMVVLVNDEVIQSENASLPKPVKKIHLDYVANKSSGTVSKPKSLLKFQQKPVKVQQKQSQKPTVKAVTKSPEFQQEAGPSNLSTSSTVLRALEQVAPGFFRKLAGPHRPVMVGSEDVLSTAKESSSSRRNTISSSILLPSKPEHVSRLLHRASLDTTPLPADTASHSNDKAETTNKPQSQESQNPIDLVLRTDGKNKKKNDVIEILD